KYAHLSEGALAMRLLYELNRYFSERAGHYTIEDKTRGALLAAEWLSYMTFPGDRANSLFAGLLATYGWPTTGPAAFTYDLVSTIDNDYGNTSSARALLTKELRAAWTTLPIR